MPIQVQDHQAKNVIYSDCRQCKGDAEILALFEEAVTLDLASPTPVRTMNNFVGVDLSSHVMKVMPTRGADHKHQVKAKAVLGVTRVKRTLSTTYDVLGGIEARAFQSETEAFAYLLSRP